jgi:hypothetical protein
VAKIIVTDLTHFKNKDIVCTAGICAETGECIRPIPYLQIKECKRLSILPGAILSGNFSKTTDLNAPHTEDRNYQNLKYLSPCSAETFQEILENTLSDSVCIGFGVQLEFKQKHIPIEDEPSHSIITLKISPQEVELVENSYKPGKIRMNFVDNDDTNYKFWPIADLGFYKYALEHITDLDDINDFINEQDELYLRIGLTRAFESPDGRNGYWLQINGIYTFPEFHEGIRSY